MMAVRNLYIAFGLITSRIAKFVEGYLR